MNLDGCSRGELRRKLDDLNGEIEDLEYERRQIEAALSGRGRVGATSSLFHGAKLPGWLEPFTPEVFYRLEGIRETANLAELLVLESRLYDGENSEMDEDYQAVDRQITQSRKRLKELEDHWLRAIGTTRADFVRPPAHYAPHPASGFSGPKTPVRAHTEGPIQ